MSGRKKIYEALLEGASNGLTDKALFDFVVKECPKATSKKIVRASLLALSDPDVRDGNILHVIYALAIRHRLDPVSAHDDDRDDDDDDDKANDKAKDAAKAKAKGKKSKGDQADSAPADQA